MVAAGDFAFVRRTGLTKKWISEGKLVDEISVDSGEFAGLEGQIHTLLEHPRLQFISHPYEWPFLALQSAAKLQLDLCIEGLDSDVMLSDASAYNIQFIGSRPVFIDHLSFRRYREGEFWAGHRQFCEQFLNPLLLRAYLGLAHNEWYRGSLAGISSDALCRLLPFRSRFNWNVFTHVFLQSLLQRRPGSLGRAGRHFKETRLSKSALKHLLGGLRNWISRLRPRQSQETVWEHYESCNSYEKLAQQAKEGFVAHYVRQNKPDLLLDVGCNSGAYSELALANGAQYVVGLDFDQGALDLAFSRSARKELNFLPLYFDAANPSPSQGWRQQERAGLAERADADGLLALAVVHHLVIAHNIPLSEAIDWLLSLARTGVIEFVPIGDPMVKQLLTLRDISFDGYDVENFRKLLSEKARVVHSQQIDNSERWLFGFERES